MVAEADREEGGADWRRMPRVSRFSPDVDEVGLICRKGDGRNTEKGKS